MNLRLINFFLLFSWRDFYLVLSSFNSTCGITLICNWVRRVICCANYWAMYSLVSSRSSESSYVIERTHQCIVQANTGQSRFSNNHYCRYHCGIRMLCYALVSGVTTTVAFIFRIVSIYQQRLSFLVLTILVVYSLRTLLA